MKTARHILKVLHESRRDLYLNLFPPMNPALKGDRKAEDQYEETKKLYLENIDSALSEFKKHDRVFWYLRAFLYVTLSVIEKDWETYSNKNQPLFEPKKYFQVFKKLDKKGWKGKSRFQHSDLERLLTHYLSLPIHKIQSFTFELQPPKDVFDQFQQWEDEWKAERNGFIPISKIPDEVETLIDYGDGFVLHDLKKNGCRQEADAMGHCSTGRRSGDINWSFRQKKVSEEDDETKGFLPLVTLIWNSQDGMVTEIKGRGNELPDEEYWPYLLEILLLDRVKGHLWPEHSYDPKNDFRVTLMGREKTEEITKIKPSIVPVMDAMRITGKIPGERGLDYIREKMGTREVRPVSDTHFGLVLPLSNLPLLRPFELGLTPDRHSIWKYVDISELEKREEMLPDQFRNTDFSNLDNPANYNQNVRLIVFLIKMVRRYIKTDEYRNLFVSRILDALDYKAEHVGDMRFLFQFTVDDFIRYMENDKDVFYLFNTSIEEGDLYPEVDLRVGDGFWQYLEDFKKETTPV